MQTSTFETCNWKITKNILPMCIKNISMFVTFDQK